MKDESMARGLCVDELIQTVATYDRATCVETLRTITWPPLDFTADFLETQSLDRLRHIVMAAMIQARRGASRTGGAKPA